MEYCACGFTDESITLGDVPERLESAVSAMVALLAAEPDISLRRPSDERWSVVEYVAHTRDVFITIRDRMVIGLVEDDPTFTPMYRDERIALGLYAADSADAVAAEIETARTLLARTFSQIEPAGLERPVRYGFPDPIHTTVGWMAKQAVHEAEHHLADIEDNLRTLTG